MNYRDDLRNWYKIYNGVISHIHILLTFPRRMESIEFAWWFHPTYIPATLNLPLAWTQFDDPLGHYATQFYLPSNLVECAAEIRVPNLPLRGAEYLYDVFFPQVEEMQTRELVYTRLRNREISLWEAEDHRYPLSNAITPDFADQALMMHDTEMLPYCVQALEEREIPNVVRERLSETSLVWRRTELLEAQRKALQGIEVEQYMELLKERKEKFLKKYKLQDMDYDL